MRLIKLDDSNKVIAVRTGAKTIHEGEIESEQGEFGQIMLPDGTFVTPEPESSTPEPTIEDKINYLYYKEMGVIS